MSSTSLANSGYQPMSLLASLYVVHDKDIGKLDVSVIPLTPRHKVHLPRLDPAQLDEDEVSQYFAANHGVEGIGAQASREGLLVLSSHLAGIGDDEVLLLLLG